MNKKIQKIYILAIAVFFVSFTLFAVRPHKAKALFGVGDFNVSDVINALKEAAQYALLNINHTYTEQYINKLNDRYRIRDYANYARNLAENVYSVRDIATRTDIAAYLVRVNISKLNGTDTEGTDLKKIYNRESLKNVDYSAFLKGGAEAENAYRALTDPLLTTPMGRQIVAESDAQNVFGNAQTAATLDILSGKGQKDLLDCSDKNNNGTMKVTNCLVNEPANYVTSQLDSKIQSLFKEQLIPQDHLLVIKSFFGSTLAKKLGDALLGSRSGSGSGNTLVDDLSLKRNSFNASNDISAGSGSSNLDSTLVPCLPGGVTLDSPVYKGGTVRSALNAIGASCTSSYIKIFTDQKGNAIFFYTLTCPDKSFTDIIQAEISKAARQNSINEAAGLGSNYIVIDPCPGA
ncbi:MAG: hypothetical protein NVSMB66_5280 [Candidatus Doudnabacteria bacterium]